MSIIKTPTTITELRIDLLDVYAGLRNGVIPFDHAREAANIVGKVINSAKLQLSYAELRKDIPDIDFIK